MFRIRLSSSQFLHQRPALSNAIAGLQHLAPSKQRGYKTSSHDLIDLRILSTGRHHEVGTTLLYASTTTNCTHLTGFTGRSSDHHPTMADNRREWVRWHSSMTPNQPPQRNQVPDLSPSTSAHSTPSTPSTRSPATPSSHASQYSHRSPPQISSPPSGSGGNRRTGTFAPAPSMPNLRGQYGTNIATSSPAPSFDNRYATPNALAQSQSRIDLRSGWQQSKEQWDALGRGPRGNYGGGNYGGGRPSGKSQPRLTQRFTLIPTCQTFRPPGDFR